VGECTGKGGRSRSPTFAESTGGMKKPVQARGRRSGFETCCS